MSIRIRTLRMAGLGVMRDALNASGRPIFFSNEYPAAVENYPNNQRNATWMVKTHAKELPALANMWRISHDIGPSWKSIINNLDGDEPWAEFAAPGSINDPDMLQVGNGEFNHDDSGALSHFALWCMLSAPLLAGNDLTKMSTFSNSIYTHAGLIAIDQDVLVSQAVVAREGGNHEHAHERTDVVGVDTHTGPLVMPTAAQSAPSGFKGPAAGIPVPFGNRRCGRCCGASDTTSAMCKGTDSDGTFRNLSLVVMASRCAADKQCVGFGQDMTECGPTCFRPVTSIKAISTSAGNPTLWQTYYKSSLDPGPPTPSPGPAPKPSPSPPPPPPPPPVQGPSWQVWKKHLADGSTAALLLNRGESPRNVTAEFADLGITGAAELYDVWANTSLGEKSGSYTTSLPPHGSLTLILAPGKTTAFSIETVGSADAAGTATPAAPVTAAPVAYKCDSVHTRAAGRFQRRYLQLECALGQIITRAAFVPSCNEPSVRDSSVMTVISDQEQIPQCVGERGCRVQLFGLEGRRHATAAFATCE